MQADSNLAANDPRAALAAMIEQVRKSPGDVGLRLALFAILAVLGEWERANTHLEAASKMDPEAMPMRLAYGMAMSCEKLRESVFVGERSPLVFGQPDPWVAALLEGLRCAARGEFAEAAALRDQALAAAPATSGSIDGQPFDWIFDPDSRLGPVLEAIVDGKYFWVPFHRIRCVEIEAPTHLIDCVWLTAKFTWANGGEGEGMIPVRYPGSASHDDGRVALSKLTDWAQQGDDYWFGVGARVLETNVGQHALLDLRRLDLNVSASAPVDGPATDPDGTLPNE